MRVKTPRPSGTITRPSATRSQAPRPLMLLPRDSMSPPSAGRLPVIAFMVVVLPPPLEPISDTSSPSRTSKSMPFTAWMPPYATFRPLTFNNVCAISMSSRAEVGLDHFFVALHFRRGALGDLLAVVEHGHPVAQAH